VLVPGIGDLAGILLPGFELLAGYPYPEPAVELLDIRECLPHAGASGFENDFAFDSIGR
jgi:hypothetical protein